MAEAKLFQGNWELISQAAQNYRGRNDLTLIVPEEPLPKSIKSKSAQESDRIGAIKACRGMISSPHSLVDDLHADRQRDDSKTRFQFL